MLLSWSVPDRSGIHHHDTSIPKPSLNASLLFRSTEATGPRGMLEIRWTPKNKGFGDYMRTREYTDLQERQCQCQGHGCWTKSSGGTGQ